MSGCGRDRNVNGSLSIFVCLLCLCCLDSFNFVLFYPPLNYKMKFSEFKINKVKIVKLKDRNYLSLS